MNGDAGQFAMWLAIGAGQVALWSALYPVLRAVGRRIEQKGVTVARVEELESRLAELEHRAVTSGEVEAHFGDLDRVAELEERLDFAERLLARREDAARAPLPPGSVP